MLVTVGLLWTGYQLSQPASSSLSSCRSVAQELVDRRLPVPYLRSLTDPRRPVTQLVVRADRESGALSAQVLGEQDSLDLYRGRPDIAVIDVDDVVAGRAPVPIGYSVKSAEHRCLRASREVAVSTARWVGAGAVVAAVGWVLAKPAPRRRD